MTRIRIFLAAFALLWATPASADFLFTAGAGNTAFDFTCFTTKHCFAHVTINSAGTELGTSSNPFVIDTPTSGNLYGAVTGPIPACSTSPCTTVIGAVVPYQGTAVLSATNGGFSNLLQGNAVLSVTNPIFNRSVAGATGGGTLSGAIAPATPAGVNLKASAGSVFRVFATTIQSTPVFIKFYNASSAPTCGSGTPVGRFMVPVAATAANGAGTNIDIGDMGAAFPTGIGYCVTGALADNDTTAITAANTLVNIVWN